MPKGKTQKQHKSGLHSNRIENYCLVRTNRLPPRYVDLVGASDQAGAAFRSEYNVHYYTYCMPIFRHLLKPIYYSAMLKMKRITT